MKKTVLSLLLISAALASASAQATTINAQGSADFRNMQISVIDLTPADGVTAGYSMQLGASNISAGAWAGPGYASQSINQSINNLNSFDITAAQATLSANVQRTDHLDSLHAAVSYSSAASNAGVNAGIRDRYVFTVQPGTTLVLTGQAQLALSLNTADNWTYIFNNALLSGDGWTSGANSCGVILNTNYLPAAGLPSNAAPSNFSCSFTNSGTTAVQTQLSFTLNSSAYREGPDAPPVPEPQTYLMLGAGLGLMGMLSRRRQRR